MRSGGPKFLGRGWAFPPQFTLGSGLDGQRIGDVAMVADEDDIRQSLTILMATRRGERVMRPLYGLGLWDQVFVSTDETSLGELRSQSEDAILFGEPRIKVEDIEIDTSAAADGVLEISIRYFIPAVNTRSNMVFPFYFREGTNLRGVDSGGDTPP